MVIRYHLNSDWTISPGHTCQGHRLHFGVGQHFKDRQTKKYFKRRRNLHDKGPSDHKPNGCHQNCRPCPPPDNLFWCCEWFSNLLFVSKFVCLCVLVRVCLLVVIAHKKFWGYFDFPIFCLFQNLFVVVSLFVLVCKVVITHRLKTTQQLLIRSD